MRNCRIAHIEYYLPAKVLTNDDLLQENPTWDVGSYISKTGVFARHIADSSETALDLALKACEALFLNYSLSPQKIDAVIFCTQSPEYILPSNASVLHGKLNLPDRALAFDIPLACSGFIYGLAIAKALICGYPIDNVLLVTADTYSKYIHEKDKSVRLLFGDGAAVTLLQSSIKGVISLKLGSYGKGFDHFIIPAGGCRLPKGKGTSKEFRDNSGNIRTQEHIAMEGYALLSLTRGKVIENIRQLLEENSLTTHDIDLFIFHQASKLVLDILKTSLQIREERVYSNISSVGNTVSASIPIAFKDALREQRVKKGDKILLCGFGAGFSWGSIILQWDG